MEKQTDELYQGKIKAGRGVKKQDSSADTEPSTEENKENDRPDERARKAGY